MRSVIWDKVWADLWHHKVRTTLAVLSISVGVFALGVIFGIIDQLTPGLNRVHQAIRPAHVTMFLTGRVDQETVDRLSHVEGVAGIEALNQLSIRYRLSPNDEWQSGNMVMRANYESQTYNLLQLKEGEWPRRNKVGIDIRAAQYLNLDFDAPVIFELEGTDRALPITGKIRHHFITSPKFGDNAYFFVDARGLERFRIPAGKFNQLLFRVEPYSEAQAHAVASEIKTRLGKIGVSVAATLYNDPNEHWGQQFFDGIYLVLQLLAVISLLMSCILIYNTLAALISQQTHQIGVMKAIGGRTHTVMKVYLSGVLAYGTLALVISLPLGAFTAFKLTAYFLDIFNVSYNEFQFSPLALTIQAAAAIAVPLLTGLWPVLNGARITVREAIASYGLGEGKFGTSPFDHWVKRVGTRLLSTPKAMALANMFRRKGRLGLTQLVLITAGTLFLMVMTLSTSITLTVANDLERRSYQAQFTFAENRRIDRIVGMAEAVDAVEQAEVWFTQPASILRQGQRTREAGSGARLVGIPAASEMFKPLITAGRWLQPGDDRVIVINQETAKENDIRLGDIVRLDLGELGDDLWLVIGFYQVLTIGSPPDDIYAPQAAIFQATTKHDVGRQLLIRTRADSPADIESLTGQLKSLFERRNWDITFSRTIYEDHQFFDNFFAQYIPMLLALAVLMAIVGGIGLMGALSISVVERTKEIGVMRAIGAKTSTIIGMLMLEGLLQGLLSWVIAVPLSFSLGQPLAALMGQALFNINLDYRYSVEGILIWLAAVLMIATLASVMPARNATSISVQESLAYA
jgi:putative ABC transport system permease protein